MDNLLLLIMWSGLITAISISSIYFLNQKYAHYQKSILTQIETAEQQFVNDVKEVGLIELRMTKSGKELLELIKDSPIFQTVSTIDKEATDKDIERLKAQVEEITKLVGFLSSAMNEVSESQDTLLDNLTKIQAGNQQPRTVNGDSLQATKD